MSLNRFRAVIDAGSGSLKIGIYKEENTQFSLNFIKIAKREEKMVLIEKINDGALSETLIAEIKSVFDGFMSLCNLYGVNNKKITILTTKWFRRLNQENKDMLVDYWTNTLGIEDIVELAAKKEAELSLLGVTSTSLIPSGNVCDMGGASIEIASWTTTDNQKTTKSVKLGIYYIKNHFKIKGRPNKQQREQITDFVFQSLRNDPVILKNREVITLDNFGGSIFALHNESSGIDDFPSHAKSITLKQLESLISYTSRISYDRMVTTPYFDFDQWELVEIAMSILRGIMIAAQSNYLTLSRTSIKEGYLYQMQEN